MSFIFWNRCFGVSYPYYCGIHCFHKHRPHSFLLCLWPFSWGHSLISGAPDPKAGWPEVLESSYLQEQPSTYDSRNSGINTLGLCPSGKMILEHVLCNVSELLSGNKSLVPTGETFYPTHPLLASFLSIITPPLLYWCFLGSFPK